jgi:hypothetical protein
LVMVSGCSGASGCSSGCCSGCSGVDIIYFSVCNYNNRFFLWNTRTRKT